ncbi:MAG TPA: site-specific integrase [Polyangiaceae bacterium]|nr:site-specific integrase [Polyangiaceae bacterium]
MPSSIDLPAATRPLRWLRIVRVRLRRETTMDKTTNWIKRWNCWVAPTKVPGVWKRKEGGHLVRARVTEPTTGCKKEIRKVLPEATEAIAYQWLADERARVKAGALSTTLAKTRFAEFAASLFERKVTTREIKSARSRERWKYTLEHLIAGTDTVPGFGEMFVDQIQVAHVLSWKTGIAKLIGAGYYSPRTANGWLAILRVITKAAKRELGLPGDAAEGVAYFDTSEHATYTEEEPNALEPDKVSEFLACMREVYPQHYAMTFLGFATGLRPSSLRPLRRKGPAPDVRWDEGVILVRRSHSLGDEVMDTTKTKLRQRISVPPDVMEVLADHVQTQLTTPEQIGSDLLFPAADGGYLGEHCLRKPFAKVGALIGLEMSFTPRGLRRTFNDLARTARVEALVTKSISGHLTDRMREHYSTVHPVEQRESIGAVLRLVKGGAVTGEPAASGTHGGTQTTVSGTFRGQSG